MRFSDAEPETAVRSELERMEELVHGLEPLALAYERFVKSYNMEPHEVYLRLTCECDGKPQIHIPGESLAAADRCWREMNGKLKSLKSAKIQRRVRSRTVDV